MNETGLIHLYCGDGKGKTTAAVGLALRCVGHGGKVTFAQFLKDGTSGECRLLAAMEGVTALSANPSRKFYRRMTDLERIQTADAIRRTFTAATAFAVREQVNLLILDEICAAIQYDFLEEAKVLSFLDGKPTTLEVVLTGRKTSDEIVKRADYITEMVKRRHPFDRGIVAREGIEY